MKERHSVVPRTLCFIFNDKDEVLLIERGPDKFDAGMFNALGGHIEKGEDIIESAVREIQEECGLMPESTKLVGIVHATNFFKKNFMVFVIKSYVTGKVVGNDEGLLHWVNTDNLDDYNIYEDIRPFLERILQFDTIFTAKSVFDGSSKLLSLSFIDTEN